MPEGTSRVSLSGEPHKLNVSVGETRACKEQMSYVKSEKWDGTNWNVSRQEVVCLPKRGQVPAEQYTSFVAASGAASIRVWECFPPSFLSLRFLKGAIRWSLSWPKTALKFPFKQHAIKPARLGRLDLSEARALAACRRPWCPWPVILSGKPLS